MKGIQHFSPVSFEFQLLSRTIEVTNTKTEREQFFFRYELVQFLVMEPELKCKYLFKP